MYRTTLFAVLLALSTFSIAAPAAKPLAETANFEDPVRRTVDETGLVSTQIEKAGDAKRSADETYISIEKATKDKRTVDETEVISSSIEKAGNAKRGDVADSNKRTVDEEFIATPIEKAGAD